MANQDAKTTRGLSHQRKIEILTAIEARETVSTVDLAQQFDVSIATITRDLQELEEKGLILRIHGGATAIRGGGYELPYLTRENRNLEEKRRIAAEAFNMVQEGDRILLDVGTTVFELAELLKKKTRITVIATSLPLVQSLASQPGIELIVIGGKYRQSELSMVGYLAEMNLRNFFVDKAFVGAAGIHLKSGITEYSYEQAGIRRVLIEQTRQCIVLADHTKFGKVQLNAVCPLSSIDSIITDRGLDPKVAESYQKAGVRLVLV